MGILSGFSTVFKGLKKNPSDRRAQIEAHEARVRAINDKLTEMIEQIRELETQLRKLFALFDMASGASKETYKVQILSLKKRIDGLKETRDLHARNLEKEQLIIRKLEFVQEVGTTQIDSDEIDTLREDLADANLDLQVEDQALNDLENSNYVQKKSVSRQSAGASRSVQTGKAQQGDFMNTADSTPEQDAEEMLLEQLRAELNQEEV